MVHDLSLAKAFGTDVLLMDRGRAVAFGPMHTALDGASLNEVFGMDVCAWNRELLAQWQMDRA